MIGKAIIGNSFSACIKYCLNPLKSPIIMKQEGVFGKEVEKLTKQFQAIANLKENVTKKVWHGAISFANDDAVTDNLMMKVVNDYLAGLDLQNNQYMVVKHQDTDHEHLHLIVNRISFSGKVVNDFQCGYRTKNLMQKLEKKYNLTRAIDQGNKRKEAIAKEIEIALLNKEPMESIFRRIENLGYTIDFNKTTKGTIRGLSFKDRSKGIVFKSSSIRRIYSYNNLLKLTQYKRGLSKSKSLSL